MKIDSYDFGEIVINGKKYTSDVIIYEDRVDDKWWRRSGHEVCLNDIKNIIKEKPDVLIIGKGYSGLVKVLSEVKNELKKQGIELVEEPTKEACNTFNTLSKVKKVIAALHLTC